MNNIHKRFVLNSLTALCFLLVFCSILQSVSAQTGGIKVANGNTMEYSGAASASYRMYGSGIKIVVSDASTYPVKGNLTLNSGSSPVSTNKDLIPYVLKVPDSWQVGAANSPFYGFVSATSELVTNWTADHLSFGVAGIYVDQERNITVLNFETKYVSQGQDIIANMTYSWDMEFGILLHYYCNITNLDEMALNGFIEMTLSKTDLWKLETGQVPGYPLEFIGSALIVSLGILALRIRKQHAIIKMGDQ